MKVLAAIMLGILGLVAAVCLLCGIPAARDSSGGDLSGPMAQGCGFLVAGIGVWLAVLDAIGWFLWWKLG